MAPIVTVVLVASCASNVGPQHGDASDAIDGDVPRDAPSTMDAVDAVDASSCPPERPTRCNGECVDDTATNPTHCGATCAACPGDPHGVAGCIAGACSLECEAGSVWSATRCVPEPGPRPVRPLANARVSVRAPVLRWTAPTGMDAVRITICRDRACTQVEHEFDANGSSARVPAPLGVGVWFWNLRALVGGVPSVTRSATWTFRTPAVDGAVEWSTSDRPDFDGDGIDDLLVYCYQPLPARSFVYRGNADGQLVPIAIWNDLAHVIGDVDGDGFTDMQVREYDHTAIQRGGPDLSLRRVLQRPDRGGFVGGSEFDIALGDFDGDGYGDAMLEDGSSTRPEMSLAYGSFAGWASRTPALGRSAGAIAYDVDADDFDDVIASGPIWWRGMPTRMPVASSTALPSMYVVPVGDLDRDGYLDAAEFDASGSGNIGFIRGSASGPLLARIEPLAMEGQRWFVSHLGDLDGDGRDDLVFRHYGRENEGRFIAYLGAADGYSSDHTLWLDSFPCTPRSLYGGRPVGDFNADGRSDAVIVCDDDRLFLRLSHLGGEAPWVLLPIPGDAYACLVN